LFPKYFLFHNRLILMINYLSHLSPAYREGGGK